MEGRKHLEGNRAGRIRKESKTWRRGCEERCKSVLGMREQRGQKKEVKEGVKETSRGSL